MSRFARLAWRGSLAAVLFAVALAAGASAHVGSPDTWFEGNAGPYPVRVVVRAPGVVPGLAEISVRVLGGHAQQVSVQPFAWNAGEHGAPPPDVAQPVPGDPQLYSVTLWFMVTTSYGVHVSVSGDEGTGVAVVPVQAVPTRRLPLEGPLALTLVALALFLFVGLLTIVYAARREATLPPGVEPGARETRGARVSLAIAAVVLVAGLVGGRSWWDSVDRAYARDVYRPFHVRTLVEERAGARVLDLAIEDPRWRGRQWTPLVPDHGKLMHLFLVRDGDMEAIAHLHPVMRDTSHFESALPPIPAGLYRVYADIVHESGFAQTLVDSVQVPAPSPEPRPGAPSAKRPATAGAAWPVTDPDDSWFRGAVVPDTAGGVRVALTDGGMLVWERGAAPVVAGAEAPLRFRVLTSDGKAARLEPFLGMAGHAVVRSTDGAVFAHLHPIGTVAMASQVALAMRTPADSVAGTLTRRMSELGAGMPGMAHAMHGARAPVELPGEFTIPYGFPRPGRYRLWVQFKRAGRVQTGAFDLVVAPARKS